MYKPLLIILLLLAVDSLFGQKLKTDLFRNVNIEGKVIELKIAPEYKDFEFLIGLGKNQNIIANTEFTSVENNIVDLRQFEVPANIDLIATTLPEKAILGKRLVKPSFSQELAILFSKAKNTLRIINFISPKTLFGYRYTLVVLMFVLVGFLLLRFGVKQSYLKAALVSSMIGFVLIDLTTMSDHLSCVQDAEKKYPKIISVVDASIDFTEKVKPIIEHGKCITKKDLPNFYQTLMIKYQFAEIDNSIRKKSRKLPKGTFIITPESPKSNQKLVLNSHGMNLLQKQ